MSGEVDRRLAAAHSVFGRLAGSFLFVLVVLGVAGPARAAVTEFPVPTPSSQPAGITAGPDGALWFTEEAGNKIGRITTGGVITNEIPIPTSNSFSAEIASGPDGGVWFTEFAANKVGRVNPDLTITEFTLPVGSAPDGITPGPDGALWFTENGTNKIGRITTTGTITAYPLPTGFRPGDITTGPDGRMWFTESEANKIGAITMAGNITEYSIPTSGSDPSGITAYSGALWFTEFGANKIGRISTTGAITEFPAGTGEPSGINYGSDGALWFTETGPNKIGRMTTSGILTNEFAIPTAGSQPGEITPGDDGALWFTEFAGNKIGRITATQPPPPLLYVRPKSATPFNVSLVPAYNECTAPNRQHGPPLDSGSCNPPAAASTAVTAGTPAAEGDNANSEASLRLRVQGSPGPPEDSDVLFQGSVSDVRCQAATTACGAANTAGGADYVGELKAIVTVRITDRWNAVPGGGGSESATVQDFPFEVLLTCADTAAADVGALCTASTSFNAVVPQALRDGKRANWQLGQAYVTDGGPDGDPVTAPNTNFLRQGVFVP